MSSPRLSPVINYTPARTAEEISRIYYSLLNVDKKILDLVSSGLVGRNVKFKNHLHRFVDVSYYNDIFTITDRSLAFERQFRIPLEISKLGVTPTIVDYLDIPKKIYLEEPHRDNNTLYKDMTDLDQIVREFRKDFNLSISGSFFSLKQLTRENSLLFDNNLIKIDSTISPGIVILRDNYKKYKRVRYSLTTELINEIKYL